MDKLKISIIGLGKLGLPLAACFASKKIKVYGLDKDNNLLKKLNNNSYNYYEPNLNNYLKINRDFLYYTNDYCKIIRETDITFIVVPTLSNKDGSFSLEYINDVIKNIAKFIKIKNKKHIIVITSTISPLSIDRKIKPLLEKETEKVVGDNIGLCYSPEFIALGSVIKNLTNPDFILIGESDKKSGDVLSKLRKSICQNNPPVIRTNFINAEIIKLALNSYITTKITFANMIARICENISGADAEIITNAIGLDSRIGKKFLKAALPYGGPCFPRDNLAFNHFIQSLNLPIKINLPLVIHKLNELQVDYFVKFLKDTIWNEKKVCFLGLTYKPDTNIIDHSFSLKLINKLKKIKNYQISVHDPSINFIDKKIFSNDDIKIYTSLSTAIRENGVLIITTPWEIYSKMENIKNKIIIDCWGIFKNKINILKNNKYVLIGKNINNKKL